MELRDYQADLINRTRESLKEKKAVIINLATGGGKTCISAFIAKQVREKGKKIIFAVHRNELLEQSSNTFRKIGISHGLIASKTAADPLQPVQIASIDTLRRRTLPYADIFFVDEAHHSTSSTWRRLIESYKKAGAKIIGLSATPWRLNGEGLGDIYEEIIAGPSYEELNEAGYLSGYVAFAPCSPDLSKARTTAGDFNQHDIEEIMDTNVLVGRAVEHYKKHADGLKAIGYAVSIKHSLNMVEAFNNSGVPAAHIDGKTQKEKRQQIVRDFALGKYKVLWNCMICTEGYDMAAQSGMDVSVEAVILSRPTQSLSLHLQMIGRGLRPKKNPCVVLDMAGNIKRMYGLWGVGLPDDNFEWTLEGRKKRRKEDAGEVKELLKQCDVCYFCHRPAKACPSCGYVYPEKERKIENIDGELSVFDKSSVEQKKIFTEEEKLERKHELMRARTYEELFALGKSRGYKHPHWWASKIIEEREKWRGRNKK